MNTVGWWVGFAWVLGLVGLAAVAAWYARRDVRVLLATLVIGSAVSWSAAFLANNVPDFFYSEMPDSQLLTTVPVRWATAASAMLASAVPVGLSVLAGRFPRLRPACWGILGVMLAVLLANVPARAVREMEPWSAQVREDIISCRTTAVPMEVATAPDNWGLGVPCSYADR